jgi:uncharacterized protein (TIGR02453 family)
MAAYFTPEAIKFLRGLKRHNYRAWFTPRKPVFERELKTPMLALIAAINDAMVEFAPQHLRPPQKAMMRIYRDTRFSADKSPYKARIAAWWSRDGLAKTSGAGYYFSIRPTEVVIAAGCYMPEREQLLAIRRHLLEHHAEMRRILAEKKLRVALPKFEGSPLTRPPKGFCAEHPGIDLIRNRQWGFSASLPAELASSPRLLAEIVQRFRAATPLIELLNAPLITAAPKRKPVFALY